MSTLHSASYRRYAKPRPKRVGSPSRDCVTEFHRTETAVFPASQSTIFAAATLPLKPIHLLTHEVWLSESPGPLTRLGIYLIVPALSPS